jgi:hypothetical protein
MQFLVGHALVHVILDAENSSVADCTVTNKFFPVTVTIFLINILSEHADSESSLSDTRDGSSHAFPLGEELFDDSIVILTDTTQITFTQIINLF